MDAFRRGEWILISRNSSPGMIFGRSDSSPSCSFSPQGLFRPAGFIPILLFFSTRIISASRIHPYLALLLHRDYFGQPDSSLSCSFAPQGLFRPAGFISILFFFSTGIISAARFHLYLALFLHRDYFGQPDSSLSCSFSPQGLFRPAGFISILLFFFTGIISAGQIHLYLALFLHRDYFGQPYSSLSCSFSPQGLFRPVRFIPAWLFCSAGIIFSQPDASLSSSFVPQGLFPPVRCIPAFLFFTTGINSTGQMHLYLVLLLRKDYFDRPDASLSSSFAPQGLFLADRMHLYLPLFHHKDYFTRPDASLPSSFSPQGLFPPARFISILLFFSTGIISTGQIRPPSLKTSLPGHSVNFRLVLL